MDDRESHFYASVARMCADAHIGGFAVRLTVTGGDLVIGVPAGPVATEDLGELDDTGFVDALSLDGVDVTLSDVVEASIRRPDPRVVGRPSAIHVP